MRRVVRTALAVALLGPGAVTVATPAYSDEKRDSIIAEYYRQHPRDDDYYRWAKDRLSWRDADYLDWYRNRTLDFQSTPGVAAVFGSDGTGNSIPGFWVY